MNTAHISYHLNSARINIIFTCVCLCTESELIKFVATLFYEKYNTLDTFIPQQLSTSAVRQWDKTQILDHTLSMIDPHYPRCFLGKGFSMTRFPLENACNERCLFDLYSFIRIFPFHIRGSNE